MDYVNDLVSFDDVRERAGGDFTVDLDRTPGAWIDVIAYEPATQSGVARAKRSGQLFAFVITGRRARSSMIRAAVYPMVDESLADATIRADTSRRLGAAVSAKLFDMRAPW